MNTDSPQTIYLKDYTPPPYLIDAVDLHFDLDEEWTIVKTLLHVKKNPASSDQNKILVLDGQDLELLMLRLNNEEMPQDQFEQSEKNLSIFNVPDEFVLATKVRIQPQNNTALEGLYKSNTMFCTQCEAEGFRKITYHLDRPDVMSRYQTTISANPQQYPVMLSNGNLINKGVFEDGRHWVKWEDPFPKPAYLFALVAGDLLHVKDTFRTATGREVMLKIFVEAENIGRCDHAMRSLKESMQWDEERFGREYDLDLFMIVAVNDFNMGAMENKGLNIFNSKLVLASPDTATDADYYNIQAVVGHEYFHNWSGNRVTCRDWFQLSLKEGFTVFRDQEFSSDLNSRAVQRIQDVNNLRTYQFPEDAGPMSHPVRPHSFMEINNFYTMTVYEKGSEVVRMIYTLLGEDAFRKGTDLYFERHDGQAVTCDDFVAAMEDANQVDLNQFKRWYSQSGTPDIKVSGIFNSEDKTFTLTVQQISKATPGQLGFGENDAEKNTETDINFQKEPYHIPFSVGLISPNGNPLPMKIRDSVKDPANDTQVLELKQETETFVFENITEQPVPSLLRGFSAPVKLQYDYSNADLAFLLANDSDDFNRWEAGQQLMIRVALEQIKCYQQNLPLQLSPDLLQAIKSLLSQTETGDSALLAQALSFPSESYLGESMEVIDVDGVHAVRNFLKTELATQLQSDFEEVYGQFQEVGEFSIDSVSMGRRSLKNIALSYLSELKIEKTILLAKKQFTESTNMTDVMAALSALLHLDCAEREACLSDFEAQWQNNTLVMDKWFSLQALSSLPDTLKTVKSLKEHACYDENNPNKIRALIGAFSHGNPFRFHAVDGSGYVFLAAEVLALDQRNPQTAARLVRAFNRWKKYDVVRQTKMKEQLQLIVDTPKISGDVYEIVSKTL